MTDVKKTMLVVIDGWGKGPDYEGNAILKADTPNMDRWQREYPTTYLNACGKFVGLPAGGLGGSEVGHLTMGAGRIVFQPMEFINRSIEDGSFFEKDILKKGMSHVREKGSRLHILGMISDKGIHSDLHHMFALLEMAKREGVKEVFIHAITDGRDVPEKSSKKFIEAILLKIDELELGKIATIIGRYYAMDRDKNWDRTKVAYDLYTQGIGVRETDPFEAIENAYARGADTDYYIDAILLDEDGLIQDNDTVIFFNFRTDRTVQITQSLTKPNFEEFELEKKVRPYFICFGPYSDICPSVFVPEKVENGLGAVIANNNLRQLRVGETEKYAHVTFFFNGQRKEPFPNEDRVLVDSPKVASYADTPEMNAVGVTREGIKGIESGYDFILLNYSNPDLVGHSGSFDSAVEASAFVDGKVTELIEAAKAHGYQILITADHGNADYMIYEETGEVSPAHSYSLVPAIIMGEGLEDIKLPDSGKEGLATIAPTILKMMGIEKPAEMTGKSLY